MSIEIHLILRVNEGSWPPKAQVVADRAYHADVADWPSCIAIGDDVSTTALVGWFDDVQRLYHEWDCERDDAEANGDDAPACPSYLRAIREMAEHGGTITVTREVQPSLSIVAGDES